MGALNVTSQMHVIAGHRKGMLTDDPLEGILQQKNEEFRAH